MRNGVVLKGLENEIRPILRNLQYQLSPQIHPCGKSD